MSVYLTLKNDVGYRDKSYTKTVAIQKCGEGHVFSAQIILLTDGI